MWPDPRAAHNGPMMINEGFAQVLVEDRKRDLHSAARWRWFRRRRPAATGHHAATTRSRG